MMSQSEVVAEALISSLCWITIILFYYYQINAGVYNIKGDDNKYQPLVFFKKIRHGWVTQMHLTGQGAANTTRDYLRVMIFYSGNAIVLATILAGFASNVINNQAPSIERSLQLGKLGFCIIILLIIFYLFLMAIRYATHFQ